MRLKSQNRPTHTHTHKNLGHQIQLPEGGIDVERVRVPFLTGASPRCGPPDGRRAATVSRGETLSSVQESGVAPESHRSG